MGCCRGVEYDRVRRRQNNSARTVGNTVEHVCSDCPLIFMLVLFFFYSAMSTVRGDHFFFVSAVARGSLARAPPPPVPLRS